MKIRLVALLAVFGMIASANAQTTLDFETDPAAAGITFEGDAEWRTENGNPGGYLKVTDAANGERGTIIFPDLTGNGLGRLIFSGRTGGANENHHIDNISVTETADGFSIGADLRVGGGTPRPADGFSFNFARPDDPVLSGGEFAASLGGEANLPEEGTQTGLGIGFDTWDSGSGDLVGMSVRVEGGLAAQIPFPTLNGAADDITSLQTGVDAETLGWSRLEIDVTGATGGSFDGANVAISYKGSQVFNQMVPEPASFGLFGLGALALGAVRRRRR